MREIIDRILTMLMIIGLIIIMPIIFEPFKPLAVGFAIIFIVACIICFFNPTDVKIENFDLFMLLFILELTSIIALVFLGSVVVKLFAI